MRRRPGQLGGFLASTGLGLILPVIPERFSPDARRRYVAERQLLDRLTSAGVAAGTAELLITREWGILAGENTTGTF